MLTTVSDKNSWDTLTKRCFLPSRAPLVPLKVVYRPFGHQILHTNIEGTRRPQSVPTILTETVGLTQERCLRMVYGSYREQSCLQIYLTSAMHMQWVSIGNMHILITYKQSKPSKYLWYSWETLLILQLKTVRFSVFKINTHTNESVVYNHKWLQGLYCTLCNS